MIPVIDLFAGPGGLGEGFSAYLHGRSNVFKIALSIEKDKTARETLKLRSFYRQFAGNVPDTYYQLLRGEISREQLYARHPQEADLADREAWRAALGHPKRYPVSKIDDRILEALGGAKNWVLIGGPPCQAYSLVGRSRMSVNPRKYRRDPRHILYRAYLRILAIHRPPVFVMENVKGILSSKFEGKLIIDRILADLAKPCEALAGELGGKTEKNVTYKLFPFAQYGTDRSRTNGSDVSASGYVICCERHGIPQARHRLILLGIRSDLDVLPSLLPCSNGRLSMWKAIAHLPPLRSQLSKGEDSAEHWLAALRKMTNLPFSGDDGIELDVWKTITDTVPELGETLTPGREFIPWRDLPAWQRGWFHDPRIGGVCHHTARAHIESDLWRYFFAACFAKTHRKSPVLTDFPLLLLPDHQNATLEDIEDEDEVKFPDRFRVQVKNRPSTTVTSHIAKDGHYFIHPDPLQCRSLTVREAARLQTFPDNYFFVGPRTEQYKQVGNAVPPLLARKLAGIVYKLLV